VTGGWLHLRAILPLCDLKTLLKPLKPLLHSKALFTLILPLLEAGLFSFGFFPPIE
jgi:hypothetical protein